MHDIPAERDAAYSEAEQCYLVMPSHINGYGRLFGGQLMHWMDQLAGVVGRRHAGCEVTTACVDQLVFRAAAHLNDTVVMKARINYTGRTSMEIRIDSYAEDLDGTRRSINRAYFIMVAIDQAGHPVPVPRLKIESDVQQAEWDSGARRYRLRKERQSEGY
ncbi:acyl-CoA thioesterase [Oscillospiraceae bacterium HV4-5-C5C]|nr:acyl-CoA thioesterase [Oscillospiraceae bacterium HV4-5-C5C]